MSQFGPKMCASNASRPADSCQSVCFPQTLIIIQHAVFRTNKQKVVYCYDICIFYFIMPILSVLTKMQAFSFPITSLKVFSGGWLGGLPGDFSVLFLSKT